jgi:hypothetical protein
MMTVPFFQEASFTKEQLIIIKNKLDKLRGEKNLICIVLPG